MPSRRTPQQIIEAEAGTAAAKAALAALSYHGYGIYSSDDVVCATHDGIPQTDEEEAQWEEGLDPCQVVIRLDEYGDVMSRARP
jgi:uncharacterized membrane protein YebE (DUF533 family)